MALDNQVQSFGFKLQRKKSRGAPLPHTAEQAGRVQSLKPRIQEVSSGFREYRVQLLCDSILPDDK